MTTIGENFRDKIDTLVAEYIEELEEKNQTLKDKIEFLTNCLDDRDKSIELMKEENKKLKKRIKKLEKICEWYEIENNIETMQNPMDPKILE